MCSILTNHWGSSTNGGVRYYIMDNEQVALAFHASDVHPVGPTMQEIFATRFLQLRQHGEIH